MLPFEWCWFIVFYLVFNRFVSSGILTFIRSDFNGLIAERCTIICTFERKYLPMKITLDRLNDDYLFECKNEQGTSLLLDNTTIPGAKGVSPMQALLMTVAGCSGIDLVSILKKQRQEISSFKAEVEGDRVPVDEANPFKTIKVKFFLEGKIDPKKAARAAELSFEKYCSVSKTLDPNVEVAYEVVVNGEKAVV